MFPVLDGERGTGSLGNFTNVRTKQIFASIVVVLLAWLAVSFGDPGTIPAKHAQTIPTTSPDPKVVLGKMSINSVELEYSGPVEVPEGMSAIVTLSLSNMQDAEICLSMYRIEQRLSFRVSVNSPKGKSSDFQTYGVACDRTGNGILLLDSGKQLEERIDLARYLTDGPGEYQITVMRDYNGVVYFPGYDLRLDVPLKVAGGIPQPSGSDKK
jgi:hypothetical protein